jgi:hypothetical protein
MIITGLPGRLLDLCGRLSREQQVGTRHLEVPVDLPQRPIAKEAGPADSPPRQAEDGGRLGDEAQNRGRRGMSP